MKVELFWLWKCLGLYMKVYIFLALICYLTLSKPAVALDERDEANSLSSIPNQRIYQQNLVPPTIVEPFRQLLMEAKQTVTVRLPNRQNRLKGRAQDNLSALGFMYDLNTGVVIYVDRNSDLYARVFQGDIYLTEDGMPANFAYQHYLNFGNQYSPVRCRFLQHGGVYECVCMRHPTSWFGPFWHQGRNRGLP